MTEQMNGVLDYDAALDRLPWAESAWANKMNFGMKHAPSAGLITRPVDLQSSSLPLCYGSPVGERLDIVVQIQHQSKGHIINFITHNYVTDCLELIEQLSVTHETATCQLRGKRGLSVYK